MPAHHPGDPPTRAALPPQLADLADRQWRRLHHTTFRRDVDALIADLGAILGDAAGASPIGVGSARLHLRGDEIARPAVTRDAVEALLAPGATSVALIGPGGYGKTRSRR